METRNEDFNQVFSYERSEDTGVLGYLGEFRVTSAIAEVRDASGKSIGEAKSVVIDPNNGELKFVVFQFHRAMGFGKKTYLIPFGKFEKDSDILILPCSVNFVSEAPSFYEDKIPENVQEYLERVYEYWS